MAPRLGCQGQVSRSPEHDVERGGWQPAPISTQRNGDEEQGDEQRRFVNREQVGREPSADQVNGRKLNIAWMRVNGFQRALGHHKAKPEGDAGQRNDTDDNADAAPAAPTASAYFDPMANASFNECHRSLLGPTATRRMANAAANRLERYGVKFS